MKNNQAPTPKRHPNHANPQPTPQNADPPLTPAQKQLKIKVSQTIIHHYDHKSEALDLSEHPRTWRLVLAQRDWACLREIDLGIFWGYF